MTEPDSSFASITLANKDWTDICRAVFERDFDEARFLTHRVAFMAETAELSSVRRAARDLALLLGKPATAPGLGYGVSLALLASALVHVCIE